MNPTNLLSVRTSCRPVHYFFFLLAVFRCLVLPVDLHAERTLRGVLINGTINHPVLNQKVELLVLGQGIQNTSEAVTNSNGEFQFALAEGVQTPHWLLRSIYRGVNYNLTVTPDQNLSVPVKLMVYEPTESMTGIRLSLPLMLAQASGNQLFVQQQFLLTNETVPPKTLTLPGGTFLFDTPSPALVSELSVAVVGIAGIPLPQNPTRRKEGGYAVHYPMKPGINEIRISYKVNYSTNQRDFKQRLFYNPGKIRLLVLPADLQLIGQGLKTTGSDPLTKAASYEIVSPGKEGQLSFRITGDAPQVTEESERGPTQGMEQDSDTTGIQVVRLPNPIFEKRVYLLAGFGGLFVMALGFALWQKAQSRTELKRDRR
jgi:hypothetical protein